MSDYRRYFVPGGTYFITIVTYNRRPILTTDLGRACLRSAIEFVRSKSSFDLVANCLLPDHWHVVFTLPSGDLDYSTRLKRIKHEFSKEWLAGGGTEAEVTSAQKREGRRGIWQPRFWEHTVVDPVDLESCVDYTHWNPVKHGLAPQVKDWQWSSFHRFVKEGHYHESWGGTEPQTIRSNGKWGE